MDPLAYRLLIRPLLFRLPPETAQRAAEIVLKRGLLWRSLASALRVRDNRLPVTLCGLKLANPVGLAAGYDKDCELITGMSALGFGYITVGTVTESARPGNPRPRVHRYPKGESLINSLGFPSKGLHHAARQLEQAQELQRRPPIIASVSGVTVEEMVRCHRVLEPLADAIELNISSPNTSGLRVFQEPQTLAGLLGSVNEDRKKPLFVKLPPYGPAQDGSSTDNEGSERVMGLVKVCLEEGIDALTVANSWPADEPKLALGRGGVSGKPVFPNMLRMVAEIKAEVGTRMAINASGGVFSGDDAWKTLQGGATTVQVLTALVYRGPSLVKAINRELLHIMDASDVSGLPKLRA